MLTLLVQLRGFMREYRKFWMTPLFLVLILLGGLVVLIEKSVFAPFIYAIF